MQRGWTDVVGSALAGSDDFREPQGLVRAGIKVPGMCKTLQPPTHWKVFFSFP